MTVGKIAEDSKVPAEFSANEHMCGGGGVCLTCVIPVKNGNAWEYQRTCTEGPVFDVQPVVWKAAKRIYDGG
jgi:dihydroorotate dehydrogenase electron transfer subunit